MSGRGNPRPAQDFLGLLTLIQHTGDVWGVVLNPAARIQKFSNIFIGKLSLLLSLFAFGFF